MLSLSLIRDLFISPGKVLRSIASQRAGIRLLLRKVLLPLLLIPATTALLGWALVGRSTSGEFFTLVEKGWGIGMEYGLVYYIAMLSTMLLSTLVLAKAAPAFRGAEDRDATFRLLVYAWVPAMLSGVFLIIPGLYWMQLPFVLYAFMLIRLGAGPVVNIPAASRTVYAITAAFVITSMLALSFLITRGLLKLFLG